MAALPPELRDTRKLPTLRQMRAAEINSELRAIFHVASRFALRDGLRRKERIFLLLPRTAVPGYSLSRPLAGTAHSGSPREPGVRNEEAHTRHPALRRVSPFSFFRAEARRNGSRQGFRASGMHVGRRGRSRSPQGLKPGALSSPSRRHKCLLHPVVFCGKSYLQHPGRSTANFPFNQPKTVCECM